MAFEIAGGNADFFNDLAGFLGLTRSQANAMKQKIALDILNGVVMKTPVDVGRARGGWDVSLGDVPPSGDDGRLDKAPLDTPPTTGTGELDIFNAVIGQDIWVTNNVVYIEVLEGGTHSDQAPQGMLAVTLAEVGSQFA